MSVPYAADTSDRYECDDDILEAAPENPVRFLTASEFVWKGMIGGITDPDRLEAYRQAEKRHIHDRYDKTAVHKHIDARERELSADETNTPLPIPRAIVPLADFEPVPEPTSADPTPAATADPVAATDGGTELAYDESDETADTPESDPDEIHPDTKGLAAGEVLELARADRTDYIFPATPDAETPYLLRAFDGDDERTDGPIGLTFDEVAKRIDGAHDPKSVGEVDVRAPGLAATNGGESQ